MQQLIKLLLILTLLAFIAACSSPEDDENSKAAQAAEINVKLGLGYLQQNNVPRAKEKLLLALKQDPKSAAANSAMAYFLERSGDVKDAEKYYQKAIKVAVVKGGPENNYGTFLCRQSRYDEAQKYFHKAAADTTYANTDQVYENAGLCAMLNSDTYTAEQYFVKAIKINPRLTTALLQVAMIEYNLANYKPASQYIQQYNDAGGAQTADVLWLQIRLAQRAGDMKTVYELGSKLGTSYPNSSQYRDYQQLKASL